METNNVQILINAVPHFQFIKVNNDQTVKIYSRIMITSMQIGGKQCPNSHSFKQLIAKQLRAKCTELLHDKIPLVARRNSRDNTPPLFTRIYLLLHVAESFVFSSRRCHQRASFIRLVQ